MCLMAFALHAHPTVGFLLAANRDEALDRPTAPLHRWHTPAGTPVLAGRDLQEGGTWLGCTPGGRVALLTNVREAPPFARWPRSRGELATRWLDTALRTTDARQASADFIAELGPQALAYSGFNLVLGDVVQGHWVWLNNRPDVVAHDLPDTLQPQLWRPHPALLAATLLPGVYGLSNAGLDTPWPKTQALKRALVQAIARPEPDHRMLWDALSDRRPTPDAELPRTGVPTDWERALSAVWVDMPGHAGPLGYGTRSSVVMQVRHSPSWQVEMTEHTWRPPAHAGRVCETWSIDAPTA